MQDQTETLAYINQSKNIISDRLFELSYSKKFTPRVVSASYYANFVAETMKNRVQGKRFCLAGKEEVNTRQA